MNARGLPALAAPSQRVGVADPHTEADRMAAAFSTTTTSAKETAMAETISILTVSGFTGSLASNDSAAMNCLAGELITSGYGPVRINGVRMAFDYSRDVTVPAEPTEGEPQISHQPFLAEIESKLGPDATRI